MLRKIFFELSPASIHAEIYNEKQKISLLNFLSLNNTNFNVIHRVPPLSVCLPATRF